MSDKVAYLANQLFKALCNRLPVPEEMKYFDILEKPSLQASQNSATSFLVLSKLCQDNPNAKKFNEIYKQLDLANIKELQPYVALLESIKKNPAIMEMLKNNEDIENENDQINLSNTKRAQKSLENLNSHNIRDNKNKKTSSASTIKNKFTSLDFLDLSEIPTCQKEFPPIKLLDKSQQENALIKDMINLLMGTTGFYIRPLPLENIERQFFIDSTMYPPFIDIVKSILVVASHVSLIARHIDVYSAYEYGAINQALAGAINQQLKDFRLLVCQMEDMHLNGQMTLTAMMNYVQEPGNMMRLMAGICSDIQKVKCKGGAILSLFSVLSASLGSSKHKSLIKHLMHSASFPFFRTLKLWIFRGVIMDTYEEFFIREDPKYQIHKSTSLSEMTVNPNFWTHRYNIETNLVPRFLEIYVDKILNTGKYLNVIQLCGFDAEFPVIEDMVYETEESYYVTQIDKAYHYASKLLLDIMFNKMKLKDHFRFMKHYFLLCEADWLSFFMELANDELNDKIEDCQVGRLESLLDVAVQSRSSGSDSLKENLKVELSNQELIPFIFHVISFKPEHKRVHAEIIGQNMRVLEAFTLNVVTEWPISLVFHKSIIQRYQILFRHLFYCHHVARVLSSVWLMNKGSHNHQVFTAHLINKANALAGRMRNFIMDLLYYMTTEVIEPFWNVFLAKLDQAQNMDEVLQFHDAFIQSCLSNCMLSSKNMLKSLQKMMVLCVTYTNRFNRLLSGSHIEGDVKASMGDVHQFYDNKPFEDMINQDDATFTEIMRNLINDINGYESDNKKLLNLAERMEYNDSYFRWNTTGSDVDA